MLRRFERASEQTARRFGLTPRQHLLLLMIEGAPRGSERSTVTELSELLQLQQSTVTELVGRAEAAGLVRREPSRDDARVVYLYLTDRARETLADITADLGPERERLAQLVATLAPERSAAAPAHPARSNR